MRYGRRKRRGCGVYIGEIFIDYPCGWEKLQGEKKRVIEMTKRGRRGSIKCLIFTAFAFF